MKATKKSLESVKLLHCLGDIRHILISILKYIRRTYEAEHRDAYLLDFLLDFLLKSYNIFENVQFLIGKLLPL